MREVRQRLVHGTDIKPEFEHELVSMFARNELGTIVTIPLLAVIFSLASMFWAPAGEAMMWLFAVLLAKFLLLVSCRQFLAQPAAGLRIEVWRRKLMLLELVNGIAWAGIALVGLGSTDASSHVFIFASLIVVLAIRMTFASTVAPILYAGTIPMTVAVVLAIRMTFASTVAPILYAGTIPMTVAVVLRLVLLGHPFYYAMAAMAIGVHIYFIFLANGLHSTALAMVEYRAEKDALIAELEEEKSISDEARRRAEDANIAKSSFLATMSHELRTPLNAILGFSEVMQQEIMGPVQNRVYREYIDNIHDSGRHLLNLINEILDLSRIEAGRFELKEEPVRLVDLAEECLRMLKLRAEAKTLTMVTDFDPEPRVLWADERAVRQMILNLLSNAVKFTPKGGAITVGVTDLEDGRQALSVRDTGPGIPPDEIAKVMEPFGQGSLAREAAEGGTGLGLPIVKSLIELHEGTFELYSELRRGTEVVIVFPRHRALATLPALRPLGHDRHGTRAKNGPKVSRVAA
jgi:two-component system cell cycle sensor histidine kinase PleC